MLKTSNKWKSTGYSRESSLLFLAGDIFGKHSGA